jgi:Beta-lactamase
MPNGMLYANGWILNLTPNGTIVWHDGGTDGFGAFAGVSLDKDIGLIVLTNQKSALPFAIGTWALDRLLDNPAVDHVANVLKGTTSAYEATDKLFAKPASPRPFPPLAPLAGNFVNPSFGRAALALDGDALVLELQTGVRLRIEPWDGDVFTVRLAALGPLAAVAESAGPQPAGFVQLLMDKEGKLGLLRLSFDDGQAFDFRRE